jgi:Cu/Zn superoxide dismutase
MRLVLALSLAAAAAFALFGSTVQADGVTGTATITKTTDGYSEIVVEVTGLEPSTEHMNHIHVGPSCTSPADHLIALENLVADAEGNASATTQAREDETGQPVTFDSVTNGSRVLMIHKGPDDSTAENKERLACGTVSASNGATEVNVTIEAYTDGGSHVDGMPSTGSGPASSSSSSTLAFAITGVLVIAGLTTVGVKFGRRGRS